MAETTLDLTLETAAQARFEVFDLRSRIAEEHGMEAVFEAQLITYLKLSGMWLGLLMNFNVPVLRDGIKRIVFD